MSIENCDIRSGRNCIERNNAFYMSGYPWLQKRIDELGIKQAEAARRCGIDPTYFNKMIKGREKRGMTANEAIVISRVLALPIEEVVTGKIEDASLYSLYREVKELRDALDKALSREFSDIQQTLDNKKNPK